MADALEIAKPTGSALMTITGGRVTIGRDDSNDVDLAWDPTVSRAHALIERYSTGWSIRDLGSSNGTFVNGKRIWAEQALCAGDEIVVGSTTIRLHSEKSARSPTVVGDPPPELTRRELDVLSALCRPLNSADSFTEPATVAELAGLLYVSEAAVKQHLGRLYAKFGIGEGEGRRRRLANEAVRRRAVSISELA